MAAEGRVSPREKHLATPSAAVPVRTKVRIKVEATPGEKRDALERAKYHNELQQAGSILSLLMHPTDAVETREEEEYDEEEEIAKYPDDAAKKLRAKMKQLLEDSEKGRRGRRAKRQQQVVVFRKSGYTRRVGLVAVASQRMMR